MCSVARCSLPYPQRYSIQAQLMLLIGCVPLLQLCVALPLQLLVARVTPLLHLPVRGEYMAGRLLAAGPLLGAAVAGETANVDAVTLPPAALVFAEDPSKALTAKDLYHDVRRLVLGIYNFVQHPSSSVYDAIAQSLPASKKKHKKSKKPANNSVQLDLDPSGNLSFNLGVAVNFQLSHNIGFSRMLAESVDSSAQPERLQTQVPQLQVVCPTSWHAGSTQYPGTHKG